MAGLAGGTGGRFRLGMADSSGALEKSPLVPGHSGLDIPAGHAGPGRGNPDPALYKSKPGAALESSSLGKHSGWHRVVLFWRAVVRFSRRACTACEHAG